MVMTKTPPEVTHLQRYAARRKQQLQREWPAYLSAQAPAWWQGSEDGWQEVRRQALLFYENRAAADFLVNLSLGWRPHELAAGVADTDRQTDYVHELQAPINRIVTTTLPDEVVRQAIGVRTELTARSLRLDSLLDAKLNEITQGTFHGTEFSAKAIIREAAQVVSSAKATAEAKRSDEAARPRLAVLHEFQAFGRTFRRGDFTVTSEMAGQLREWKKIKEQEMRDRGWAAPFQFTKENWPPFELHAPGTAAAKDNSAPAGGPAPTGVWG